MSSKLVDGGTRMTFGENSAQREETIGKGRPDLITPYGLSRLSKHYENGANKYGDRNYEKGMPFSRYTASMFRHVIAWMKGDNTEDHLSAIAWNALAIIHHQELGELQWDDMPHYESREDKTKNAE